MDLSTPVDHQGHAPASESTKAHNRHAASEESAVVKACIKKRNGELYSVYIICNRGGQEQPAILCIDRAELSGARSTNLDYASSPSPTVGRIQRVRPKIVLHFAPACLHPFRLHRP